MDIIERATEFAAELKEHKDRLKARANEILQMAANAPPDQQQILKLVSQSFTEQVDTGLEFLQEMVEIIVEGFDSEEEGGDLALTPEETATLLGPLTTHRSMLDELIKNAGDKLAEKTVLEQQLDACLTAIKLVEDLAGEGEAEGDEGEGEDE